jgi:hypothetical protein
MASSTNLTASTTTPYATLLNVDETNGAAAAETVDLVALLALAGLTNANSPLFAGLNQAFSSQANAQAYLDQNVDLMTWFTASNVTTGQSLTIAAAALVGTAAGNFRLSIKGGKAANTDTYTGKVRVALRHSIVR